MRALVAYPMGRSVSTAIVGAWVAVVAPAPAFANVITDWDEKSRRRRYAKPRRPLAIPRAAYDGDRSCCDV